MTEFDVGARLRELRLFTGKSQRQLAEAAGVPHGQISMVETNKSSPSVASLRKILGGLGIGMSEFFEPDSVPEASAFHRAEELRDLTSRLYAEGAAAQGKITLRQVGDARAHNLQILHETYAPGADTGKTMLEHVANEGGVVIAGEIELTVGGEVRVLRAGDAFLFNSQEPHRFRNLSEGEAVVISACTPPYL